MIDDSSEPGSQRFPFLESTRSDEGPHFNEGDARSDDEGHEERSHGAVLRLDDGRVRLSVIDATRPETYGDCLREGWGDHDATGPCPWVSCAHHLAWGRAKVARHSPVPGSPELVEAVAELDLDQMPHTCALRVADAGATLADIGEIFGTSRERIRQVESECLSRLTHKSRSHVIAALRDEGHAIERPDLHAEQDDGPTEPLPSREALIERALREATASNDNAPPAARRPRARVLTGDERAQRIAELRARQPRVRRIDACPRTSLPHEPEAQSVDRFTAHEVIEMVDELAPRAPTLAEVLR